MVLAGGKTRQQEGPRVGRTLKEELILLFRAQGLRIFIGGGVEGRHHAKNPLMLLFLQLFLGLFPLFFPAATIRNVPSR